MSRHDCIKRINGHLAGMNTEVATALSFQHPESELIQVATIKADSSKRGRPMSFFATFCPFCGVRLKTSEPASAAGKSHGALSPDAQNNIGAVEQHEPRGTDAKEQ